MELVKKILMLVFTSVLLSSAVVAATSEQLHIDMEEYVDQTVIFYPLGGQAGTWYDQYENQSHYNLTGYITVTNTNAQNQPMSDIYISFQNPSDITLPTLYAGRTGTWISSNLSASTIVLHIPEILPGQNSTWVYSINATNIKPPLNLTTAYDQYKILAGENFTLTDTLSNEFINKSYQGTCIFDINLTQTTTPVNFSGSFYDYQFLPSTIAGTDSANVVYFNNNHSQQWDVQNGGCLNGGGSTDINYMIESPLNIPTSQRYRVTNTTLVYSLNETISYLNVTDVKVISEANVSFEKQIVDPSHPTLYGSNVTWNVTGYFSSGNDVTYNLTEFTLWVSKRNVNGSFTDPNVIDNDTINSSIALNVTYYPNTLVNGSQDWSNPVWQFNYSDIPSPIVWMDVDFKIHNDGAQLIDKSFTRSGNDVYIKELYLIIGYWLEVEKNITSVADDTYTIDINVWNKGNQVTPQGSVVTIYDFVPDTFSMNESTIWYDPTNWYTIAISNTSITGGAYNGTLYQWALVPNNSLNVSFDQGPAKTINTTWAAHFNVTGVGDYTLLDVFITGLDPQKVDGAGGTRSVVVSEVLDRIKSTEGIFAVVASILLLLGLLL